MKEAATIYTLAEELGMTPSMVSRALNPNGKVAPEKRQLVLEAAQKHHFVPNRFASRLSRRQVKVGVLLYVRAEHVLEQMLAGLKRAYGRNRDYKVEYTIKVIRCTEKEATECEKDLMELVRCDGVILAGFSKAECTEMIRRFLAINPNVVFLQNVCEETDYLFASKHNEELASHMAAELLGNRLYYKARKNILLFTGDIGSSVHRRASAAFRRYCKDYGLELLDAVDMHDSEEFLREQIGSIMKQYEGLVDGIYITSGNSVELCRYLREKKLDIGLVTFDVYEHLCEFIEDGTICATIFQNIAMQAERAFDKLVAHLIEGELPQKTEYTEVTAVMRNNLALYRE